MIRDSIRKKLESLINDIITDLRNEIDVQGHNASGSLSNTLNYKITESDQSGFLGVIFGNEYWVFLENGVTAQRIPYSGARKKGGGGRKSKYIEELKRWAEIVRPELSDEERTDFAFAVANTHRKEGMPSRESYQFSRNNKRKEFAKSVLDNYVNNIVGRLELNQITDEIAIQLLNTL